MPRSPRRSRPAHRHRTALWRTPVTLRMAVADDEPALARLAGRETRPLPQGPFLVAVHGEQITAAISLIGGELLADPFQRTAELCDLLRCHAGGARVAPTEPPAEALALRAEAALA